jgi:hypothetical protein
MKHRLQPLAFLLLTSIAGFSQPVAAQSALPKIANEQIAEEYVLTSAFPNPFNTSTRFNITVRQRQQVKVQVFNILGQPVRELYDGTMEAGETRTFTFEGGDLPSGIYIYRVRGERFTAARQTTLLK